MHASKREVNMRAHEVGPQTSWSIPSAASQRLQAVVCDALAMNVNEYDK